MKILDDIKTIKFKNLSELFQKEYFVMTSNICPLIVANRSSFLINELYSNPLGVYFSDFNLLLNNINDLTEEDSKGYQEIFLKRSNLHVKY
jgi:hypothetical protein